MSREGIWDTPLSGVPGIGKRSPPLKKGDWHVDPPRRFIIEEDGTRGRGISLSGRMKMFQCKGRYPTQSVLDDVGTVTCRYQELTPAVCQGSPGWCQGNWLPRASTKAAVRPELGIPSQEQGGTRWCWAPEMSCPPYLKEHHWQNKKVCERENKRRKVALHNGVTEPFVFSSARKHLLSCLTSHESFNEFSVIFSGKKYSPDVCHFPPERVISGSPAGPFHNKNNNNSY